MNLRYCKILFSCVLDQCTESSWLCDCSQFAKNQIQAISSQDTHKLSHQESEATFEHLGPNIFSLQEYPSKSPLGINTPRGGRSDTGSYA